jgi:hypothetical protein
MTTNTVKELSSEAIAELYAEWLLDEAEREGVYLRNEDALKQALQRLKSFELSER